jgi:MFS family permease
VPGFLALLVLLTGIRDVPAAIIAPVPVPKTRLSPEIKRYFLVIGLFGLANSSDAFILLRAQELGFTLTEILALIALLNVVSSATALPAAILSDRFGRRALIATGWIIYAACYAAFSLIPGATTSPEARMLFIGTVAVYGLFFGFTESVEKAWVADLAPPDARGRAFGIFGLIVGISTLPASLVFGFLWDRYWSEVPFLASATIAFFATGLLFFLTPAQTARPRL